MTGRSHTVVVPRLRYVRGNAGGWLSSRAYAVLCRLPNGVLTVCTVHPFLLSSGPLPPEYWFTTEELCLGYDAIIASYRRYFELECLRGTMDREDMSWCMTGVARAVPVRSSW